MSPSRVVPLLAPLAMAVAVLGLGPVALGQCFVAKALPGDTAPTQLFGEAVSQADDRLLCGARGDDEYGPNAGAAYIFGGLPAPPTQQAKVTAPDARPGQIFSAGAVSLRTPLAAIGAVLDDDRGVRAGAAYIFREDRGTWIPDAKLHSLDTGTDDRFGKGIALPTPSTVFIGARLEGFAGATYVFARAGDTWQEFQKLTPTGATLNALFGERIAVDGDTLAGGAVFDSERGNLAGAVFVFERGGDGRWAQVAKLMASDGGENDQFGYALAIQGDTLFVGAPLHNGFASNGGAVYVFHRDAPGVWTQVAKLGIPGAVRDDLLGGSLAIEGELLAVGADPYEDPRGHFAGDVRLFREESPGEWRYLMRIATDDRRGGDVFGYSLALQAGMLLVGAPFHDGPAGEDSGAVYVYDLTRGPGGGLIGKPGDINKDGVTDLEDYKLFAACLTGPETPVANLCLSSRLDCDADADLADLAILQQHLSGE